MKTEDLERKLAAKVKKPSGPDWSKGLSSGSTLLNLACSGRSSAAFIPGRYFFYVGDSSSGKTFFTMTTFAEACRHEFYRNHRLIYDGPEMGADMDWAKFFGPTAASKIEARPSKSLEDFYWNIDRDFDAGKPFIRVLDSMDALVPRAAVEKFNVTRKAVESGKKITGSMMMDKPKINSQYMPILFNKLREEGKSIIIIISQTRDNIGFEATFTPKTRSGGHALTFYAALEIHTKRRDKVRTKFRDKEREQGIIAQVQVKKNRLTGKDRTVFVPFLYDVGIDDISGCIDFLLEEGHWKKKAKEGRSGIGGRYRGTFEAPEFDFRGTVEQLATTIDESGKVGKLRRLVATVWREIEEAVKIVRKPRYA